MTEGIKQIEKGALQFAKDIFGKALADAMYLGTFKGVSYFGPIFYERDATRKSFLITYSEDKYDFLLADKFSLDSDEELKDFQHRQHIWWDYIGVIQSAYRRGKHETMASRMKTDGTAVELISKTTGLTADEIEGL